MKPARIRVSDHAVLRYLERVGGFDVERLRQQMADRVGQAVAPAASGVIIDGFNFRIGMDDWGQVVTTVLPADGCEQIRKPREAGR